MSNYDLFLRLAQEKQTLTHAWNAEGAFSHFTRSGSFFSPFPESGLKKNSSSRFLLHTILFTVMIYPGRFATWKEREVSFRDVPVPGALRL